MGLIKEPPGIDFVVNPRALTPLEEKAISDFIKADKAKRKRSELRKSTVKNTGLFLKKKEAIKVP